MSRTIDIRPVTRIEGHAAIDIRLDDRGRVDRTRLHITSLRGFEKFLEGRQAEEAPRIVSRICGICPWMHHAASVKAVDGCFGVQPPEAGNRLRELMVTLAHINDKILHFFFLAAPDFMPGDGDGPAERSIIGLAKAFPELGRRVGRVRRTGRLMVERFVGRDIHPVAMIPGGFAKPMSPAERDLLLEGARKQLEFALWAMDWAEENIFPGMMDRMSPLGGLESGFLALVRPHDGALALYDGELRLMRPDGSFIQFAAEDYRDHLAEHVEPWSYARFPYARNWGSGLSLDPDQPGGVYRVNTLARINAADLIDTPLAQGWLDDFRARFGRPAQNEALFHRARLIELIHAAERAVEMLSDPAITGKDVSRPARPGAGRGVGCVEAPRGTLIHDYTTDDNGLITRAEIMVGTTHNLAPMNISVALAARRALDGRKPDAEALNLIETALRAYDP